MCSGPGDTCQIRSANGRVVFEFHRNLDPKTRRAVGSLLLALMSGVTVQVLLDPKSAPTADDLTLGMKTVAKAFTRKG